MWHHRKESNLHCRFRRPEYTPLYDGGIIGAPRWIRTIVSALPWQRVTITHYGSKWQGVLESNQ